jgi:hypothetical protein
MSKIIPTLFIGLGGTGFYAISEIKKTIANKYFGGNPDFPLTSYLAIDTEFLTADKVDKLKSKNDSDINFITTFDASNIKDIERIETVVIPDNIKSILEKPAETGLEDFVPERANECIEVKGDGASGVGLVGKIVLANHFAAVANRVKEDINTLLGSDVLARLKTQHSYSQFDRENRINAFIFCSFGGGTGKGMALIIAAMCKELLNDRFEGERQRYNISIINYLPACFRSRGRSVANDESTYQYILKNQYATYKEFEWCITHGYNNENFFKKYFNRTQNIKTEDFVNIIYNISPNLENSGTNISSYDSVNKIVADVFTFLVMNPESYAILQAISNDTQKTGIAEKGTNLQRNRKYSRIGRYSLVMPEKELFEYAKIFYLQKLIDDFLQGGIEKGKSYKEITGPGDGLNAKPENMSQTKNEELYSLFVEHYNGCPQLNSGGLIYPDVRNYQLSSFIKPVTSEIQTLETLRVGFEKAKKIEGATKLVDDVLLTVIKNSGLLYARDFLIAIIGDIEVSVHSILEKIHEKNDYGAKELLQGLGAKDIYNGNVDIKHFKFNVAGEVLNRLRDKVNESVISLNEFGTPEKFTDLTALLEPLRKPRKKGFWKMFGVVDGDKIPFPEDAKTVVYSIVNKFNKQLIKTWSVYIAREYLSYAIKLNEHIETELNKINDFITVLQGKANQSVSFLSYNSNKHVENEGLLKEIDNALLQKSVIYREANESNVIGDNNVEFKLFATKILHYDSIINDIHSKFNANIVDKLFDSNSIKANSDEISFTVMRLCDERLEKERYDENKNTKWTILNYLNYSFKSKDHNTRQQVEENLQKIKLYSRFLSSVDVTKFVSTSAAEASFPQYNFLEISDTDFFPTRINNWKEYVHNAKLIPQDNENKIVLTRIQGLIPLFAFTDLQEAQKLYKQSLLDAEQDEYKKHVFKVKTHSSSFFMEGIDEPFGQTLQIDRTDVINTWNMAFHLGIVNVNGNGGYVQIIGDAFKQKLTDYHDPNKNHIKIMNDRRVRLNDYVANYMNYYALINTINDLIFERLNMLAKSKDGKEILQKYLANIRYPILTKPLFSLITTKLEDRKYGDLIYFIQEKEQNYLLTYQQIADSIMKTRKIITNDKELKEEYNGATQYLNFFSSYVERNGSEESEASKSEKLKQITSTTKWDVIMEQNKNSKVSKESQSWQEINKLYAKQDTSIIQLNMYAPDLDLVLSYNEFKELLPSFELEELINNAGYDSSIINKRFHVASEKSGGVLTKEMKFGVEKILKLLNDGDNTLYISEKEKPQKKEDWKLWSDIKEIKDLYDQSNNKDDDEIVSPF